MDTLTIKDMLTVQNLTFIGGGSLKKKKKTLTYSRIMLVEIHVMELVSTGSFEKNDC